MNKIIIFLISHIKDFYIGAVQGQLQPSSINFLGWSSKDTFQTLSCCIMNKIWRWKKYTNHLNFSLKVCICSDKVVINTNKQLHSGKCFYLLNFSMSNFVVVSYLISNICDVIWRILDFLSKKMLKLDIFNTINNIQSTKMFLSI